MTTSTTRVLNAVHRDKGGAVFNVRHKDFGAKGDGTTDDTAAIRLAVLAATVAGGVVYFPVGAYLVTDTVTIDNHGVRLVGASWRSAGILFNPGSGKVCFDFIYSSSTPTLTNCGVEHLYGYSSNTTQKTFLRLTDVSGFELHCVRTQSSWSSAAAGATSSPASPSIGLELRGRELVRADQIEFFADKPIQISQNPRHASIDADFFQFNDTYLGVTGLSAVAGTGTVSAAAGVATFSTSQAGVVAAGSSITVAGTRYQVDTFNGTTGATISSSAGLPTFGATAFTRTSASSEYAVTIGTATTNEIRFLNNLHFGGENIWVQGKGGISWVGVTGGLDCTGITIENARSEQTQNSQGYFLNIDRGVAAVYGVRLVNCAPSFGQHAVRLRRCTHWKLIRVQWPDNVGVNKVLDIDATVTKGGWEDLWTQTGGQASIVGNTLFWGLTRQNSVDLALPTHAYYDTSTNGASVFGNIAKWMASSRMMLPSDALLIVDSTNSTVLATWQPTGRLDLTSGVKVGTGAAITNIQTYTPTLTPASVAAGVVVEQTFTVTGLLTTDTVYVNPPATANNVGIAGVRVSAADTLAIRFVNPTAGALTPTSGTYTVKAIR